MSGLKAFALPAINLKLHGWMPIIYKRGQESSRVGFGVGILCALLFMCWTHVRGLVDYKEFVLFIFSSIAYTLIVCRFINSFFCNYSSLLLLWVFSIFCVNKYEETEKRKNLKIEENAGTRQEDTSSSAVTSLLNAEKFVKLFQTWLYEEETLGTESESIEEKNCKLKIASKELKKVQIITDSLKTQVLYNLHSPRNESSRVQNLIDKFEHTKTYIELRRNMLDVAQRQLTRFTEQGMALKIWLSEALEILENLHRTTCISHSDLQQQFSLLLGIRKDSEVIRKKLAQYEHWAQSLTATLQEMSACSGIFHKALEGASSQHGIRKWHDILAVSITEEATQVAQRFSTLTKLNESYRAHLDGLHQRVFQQFKGVTLQEDSKLAVVSGLGALRL